MADLCDTEKPTLRIIRSLARSGGTLVAKCLGCMDDVTLISEVHPGDPKSKIRTQAHEWFDLIDSKTVRWWKIRRPSMLKIVSTIEPRATARGEVFVLRDWSHWDYIGVPFTKPKFGYALKEALESMYDIRTATTVRHPIDQYMSLIQLSIVARKLDFDSYLYGCMRFAEYASEHGFYRYEDFTKAPDNVLGAMCEDLKMPFDSQYVDKWHAYTTITGDTVPTLGRGVLKKSIQSFDRKPIDKKLLDQFRANKDYLRACALLGYSS